MTNLTYLLERIQEDDPVASEQLLPLVYDELRKLAARELRGETSPNTLQPTALVHEAYVRLIDSENEPKWCHRGHFYSAAAEAMRRILIESARRKQTLKRGGNYRRVPFDRTLTDNLAATCQTDLLELDEAMDRLAQQRPELAELVKLRYFVGLTHKEAAEVMQISASTADR